MRQLPSGDWVRDQHTVRASAREAPWALEDVAAGKGGHGPTRLPVLNALRCGRISLELAGVGAALAHSFRLLAASVSGQEPAVLRCKIASWMSSAFKQTSNVQ